MPGSPSCQFESSLWADMSGGSARAGAESNIGRKRRQRRSAIYSSGPIALRSERGPEGLTTFRPRDRIAAIVPAGGSLMRAATRFAMALTILIGIAGVANAETVMKQCGDQWQAAKASGTTNGQTWPQFLKQCRAQLASTGGATSTPAGGGFAPAAPQPSTPAPGSAKTASQCNAEYAANKAAIRASGQTKREFVAACRAGNENIPQGAAAAPAPTPAPAPTQSGSLFPWQQPAAPAPAPTNYANPAATGAGQFASAQEAQSRCPGATVVWVNEHSHIYHFAGTRDFGNTKRGAYMCEAEAQAAGNRAAMNERHP